MMIRILEALWVILLLLALLAGIVFLLRWLFKQLKGDAKENPPPPAAQPTSPPPTQTQRKPRRNRQCRECGNMLDRRHCFQCDVDFWEGHDKSCDVVSKPSYETHKGHDRE